MIGLDLLPQRVSVRQKCNRHMRRWAGVWCLILIAVLIPLVLDWLGVEKLSELRAKEIELKTSLVRVDSELAVVKEKVSGVAAEIERAKAFRAKRCWRGLLHQIASSMPTDLWLTSVATDPPAPAGQAGRRTATRTDGNPASIEIDAARRLVIAGWATTNQLPWEFMAGLNKTGLFKDVEMHELGTDKTNDRELVRFQISVTW